MAGEGVALPLLEADAFDGDGAEAGDVDELGVFLAVAEGAGGDGDGVRHFDAAEVNA